MIPMTPPDQYGQRHPIESDAMITRKLVDLESEIMKISKEKRAAYSLAKDRCPELLTDEFKLMFLRSEVFNADVSFEHKSSHALRNRIKFYELTMTMLDNLTTQSASSSATRQVLDKTS